MIVPGLTSTTSTDLDRLSDAFGSRSLTWEDYAVAGLILVGGLVLARVLRGAVRRVVDRSRADDLLGDLIGRVVQYVVVVFAVVYALDRLGISIGPILGALGIVGVALAFAFQDILENFVAGVILQIQRPFAAGDEIVVGDHEGAIVSVDARTITIENPDGETIRIPSAEVIKNPIVNYTQRGRRRTTVDVGVAYGTNLERAAEVARAATAAVDGVLDSPAPQVLVHTFGNSSIDLAVRYWHEPSIATHWRTRHLVATAISRAFEAHDITIPFPQRVLHLAEAGHDDRAATGDLGAD